MSVMNRREWLAAGVIAVLAVAAAIYLLRDTREDPAQQDESDDPPSARVMSIAAADELIDRLTQDGWRCFDSLPEPVVKRCFIDQVVGGGTTSGEVALTYQDGYVARANVYAAGERDGGRHVEVAEQTVRLAGDVLLDDAGSVLVDRLGNRREFEVAGRLVYGNRSPGSSVQVVVESASYNAHTLPPPNIPAKAKLTSVAEAGGLTCRDYGATTTCGGRGSPAMTVTIPTADGRVGSLTLSASNYAVPKDPAVVNRVAGYLFETGLGGSRAAAWLRQYADSTAPVRADLGGVHLRIRGGDDHTVYLVIGEITN
jgi:hypothetical protein